MEKKDSCAECLNLGRAVYCMQCIRMNKGRKDMFLPNSSFADIPRLSEKDKASFSQPAKR